MGMDDVKLALLGDRATQERLTEAGVLLPCPFCHANPTTRIRVKAKFVEMVVVCFKCGTSKTASVEICDTEFDKLNSGMKMAMKEWNTRAAILTPEQLEALERMEGMK